MSSQSTFFKETSYCDLEKWMLHFFNIAREKNRFFLLISRNHSSLWPIKLSDLRSRLFTLPTVNIKNPNDELLLKIGRKLSKDIGVIISDDALVYIMNFIDRNVTTLLNTLKILDKLALQKQKTINISFIKNYLVR
jgi:chromosomal replication initiation ATPase DnaA